jgi:hypothetical protein
MKINKIILILTLATVFFTGCSNNTDTQKLKSTDQQSGMQQPQLDSAQLNSTQQQQNSDQQNAQPEVVATPSVVTDENKLHKAASKEGSWIIILKRDFVSEKEIVLEGEFAKPDNNDNSKQVPAGRKIALYDQDQNRVKTATYTLKAPKLTVRSENTRLQGGTFQGDVYVESKGFSIVDAKVEGNVYFANEEVKSTFKLENGSSVTGVTEVKK